MGILFFRFWSEVIVLWDFKFLSNMVRVMGDIGGISVGEVDGVDLEILRRGN